MEKVFLKPVLLLILVLWAWPPSSKAALWEGQELGLPLKVGSNFYFTRPEKIDPHPSIWTSRSLQSPPTPFLDPKDFRIQPGQTLAFSTISWSPQGNRVAFSLRDVSDPNQKSLVHLHRWKMMDVPSRKIFPEELKGLGKGAPAWDQKGEGFYYPGLQQSTSSSRQRTRVLYHRTGTDPGLDSLAVKRRFTSPLTLVPFSSEDGNYLVLSLHRKGSPHNGIFYRKLDEASHLTIDLIRNLTAGFKFLGSRKNLMYFFTNYRAPFGKVIAIDHEDPQPAHWNMLIPKQKDPLEKVSHLDGRFFAVLRENNGHRIEIFDRKGKFIRRIKLNGSGWVKGFEGGGNSKETFYALISPGQEPQLFHYHLNSNRSTRVQPIP